MRRTSALVGSGIFLAVAPGIFAGYIPFLLSNWQVAPAYLGVEAFRWLGMVGIGLGIAILLDAFARFAWQGGGTPAPIMPPETLVATGPYRHVRNPMYVAVVSIIFGQALLFGRPSLLAYGAAVWLAFHLFVILYEEPTLRATFGPSYDAFCRSVPRWLPRLRPAR